MPDQSIDFDLFLQNQGYYHPQAIPFLIEEYYGQVRCLMASLLPDHQDNVGISQSVMETVAINLSAYQPGTNFKVWLFTQAVKTAESYWRSSKNSLPPLDRTENTLEPLIKRLTWANRLPLILRYAHKLSLSEIAQVLRMPIDQARYSVQQSRLELLALDHVGFLDSWELYHQEFKELVSVRLDGEISKQQLAYLDRHLEDCSRCAKYYDQVEKVHVRLGAELPGLWPEGEVEAVHLDQVIKKVSDRITLKRILHQSTRTAKGSGLVLLPLIAFILLVWNFNTFVTSEIRAEIPIAAHPRFTNTAEPTRRSLPARQVIQVVAKRSLPGFYARGRMSAEPAISADGRWVVFSSNFANQVENDAKLYTSILFMASTSTDSIERLNATNYEGLAESPRVGPDISADGTKIIFLSSVAQAEQSLCTQESLSFQCVGIYLYDKSLNETRLLTIMSSSTHTLSPLISNDGRWLAYWSTGSTHVDKGTTDCGDPHGCLDIYLLDLTTNAQIQIPVGRPTSIQQRNFFDLDITSDGRKLVFPVLSEDAIYRELSNRFAPGVLINMFVYDLEEERILPVNVSPDSAPGSGASTSARISGDGRSVIFASYAENLTNDNPRAGPNLYLRDMQSGQIERIEVARHGGKDLNALSDLDLVDRWFDNLAISENGQVLVFLSADERIDQANHRMCSSAWVGRYDCYRLVLYDRIDKTSRVVDIGANRLFQYVEGNERTIHPDISADGTKIVFVGHELDCLSDSCPQVFIYDTHLGETRPVRDRANHMNQSQWSYMDNLDGHDGWVNSVAYSADGRFLASGGADGIVRMWQTDTWFSVAVLEGHTRPVTQIAFSSNGRYLVTGGLDGLVRVWWLPLYLVQELECIPGEVLSLAISPDGRILAVGSSNGLHLLSLSGRRSEPCQRALFLPVSVNTMAFSPNGMWLAIGSKDDGKVRLYQLPDGQRIYELVASRSRILALAFSPNGRLLASASQENDVNLWELSLEAGQFDVAYLETIWHGEWVKALAFSTDGALLATGSFDNAIRLWDIETRGLFQTLWRTRQDQVQSLAFSPDGKTLASGSVQGIVRLWGSFPQAEPHPIQASYFTRNQSNTIGYLYANEPRSLPVLGSGLSRYLSVSEASKALPFDIKIPGIKLPRLTPTIAYTWQTETDTSPTLMLNYIYATNYQPSYLRIRQGLDKSQVYADFIGATAIVEVTEVGAYPAEYVHGDWSVEDNSIPFVNDLVAPRMRWDVENGSHWLRWQAGDVYISLEFHTPFSDRLIDEDERVTKELLLAIAESLIPLEP